MHSAACWQTQLTRTSFIEIISSSMAEAGEAKDLGDRLRTEASEASPKLDRAIARIAPVFCDVIEADFGQYMPGKARDRGREASKNIILTMQDEEIIIRLAADYCEELGINLDHHVILPDLGREEVEGSYADGSKIGFQLITIDPNNWEDFSKDFATDYDDLSVEQKKGVNNFPGIQDHRISSSDFWNCVRYFLPVAHEIGHAYQDQNLSTAWKELIANMVSRDVVRKLMGTTFTPSAKSDFTDELFKKYGKNNVMRLFFGTLRNPITRARISSEMTDEKRDAMFPEKVYQRKFQDSL